MNRSKKPSRMRVREHKRELRRAINLMDFVASVTIHKGTKVCARQNCRCATNPALRHDPYYACIRRQDGRLIHSVITSQQTELFTIAIQNYRDIQQLLRRWERETTKEVLTQSRQGEKA